MATRAVLAFTAAGLAGLTLALAGCGSDGNGEAATTATGTATPAAPAPTTKVSANDASREELTAAFEAAGIPSAEKWAEEVTEYRPYPVEDVNWTQLRTELAKYNPPPDVLEKIIAMMEP